MLDKTMLDLGKFQQTQSNLCDWNTFIQTWVLLELEGSGWSTRGSFRFACYKHLGELQQPKSNLG